MAECPICNPGMINIRGGSNRRVECSVCGIYAITYEAMVDCCADLVLEDIDQAVARHYVRRRQIGEDNPTITADELARVIEDGFLPNARGQFNNLILHLGWLSQQPGEYVDAECDEIYAIIGSKSLLASTSIVSWLVDAGYIKECTIDSGGGFFTALTLEGWSLYEKLQTNNTDTHFAFMAMGYGNPEVTKFFQAILKPAVKLTGYELERLDERPEAGIMDNRMQLMIKDSRFLVVDITDGNQGAYWEAGYAHGLGKPVFYTCRKTEWDEKGTHFDVNHHLTAVWNESDPDEAADLLKAAIRNTIPEAKRE